MFYMFSYKFDNIIQLIWDDIKSSIMDKYDYYFKNIYLFTHNNTLQF